MKPKPDEEQIVGHWIFENGKMIGDENCGRIYMLTASYFKKIEVVDGGWSTIYQDPETLIYWKLTYPKGELHGGGPPALYRIDSFRQDNVTTSVT